MQNPATLQINKLCITLPTLTTDNGTHSLPVLPVRLSYQFCKTDTSYNVVNGFYSVSGLPHVISAHECTHVPIQFPDAMTLKFRETVRLTLYSSRARSTHYYDKYTD